MAQVYSHAIINDESEDGTYGVMTNQGNVVARTIYVSGTFEGTVKIEASPTRDGNDWVDVFSGNAVGVHAFDVDPVCLRLRGKLSDMTAGSVTVVVACRVESRG